MDNQTQDKELFYTIDILDEAISQNKKVAFLYKSYGPDKKLHPKREAEYIVNPCKMAATNGRYYLICNYDKYDNLIDRAADGTLYLVIHSGSRNLGKQVAELYQQLVVDLHMGKEDFFKQRKEIIRTYKAEGKRAEFQQALKALTENYETQILLVPNNICWLYGTFLAVEAFHTINKYIDMEEMILRKGAIAAQEGEKVLIPINMRDGSVLAVGRGNPEWNYFAPHEQDELYPAPSVNEKTIDEGPMAYKSFDDIIDVIRDCVDIIDIMKPVYNFKASDDELPWKRKMVNMDERTDSQKTK